MKYLIINYASIKYKKLCKKYKKILVKLDNCYSYKLNLKREKLFKKILIFERKWRGCIYEI